jgi:hypothetical protein
MALASVPKGTLLYRPPYAWRRVARQSINHAVGNFRFMSNGFEVMPPGMVGVLAKLPAHRESQRVNPAPNILGDKLTLRPLGAIASPAGVIEQRSRAALSDKSPVPSAADLSDHGDHDLWRSTGTGRRVLAIWPRLGR